MKYLIVLFALTLYYPSICIAQQTELGFRLESFGLKRSYSDGDNKFVYFPVPEAIKLNIGIYPVKNLALELRGGRLFYFDNFTGYEYDVYTKYLFNDIFFLVGGVSWHLNEGGGGGIYGGSTKNTITMPAVGFGIKPWNHTGFELMFQKANNETIGWSTPDHENYYSENLDWLVKLSIFFAWKL